MCVEGVGTGRDPELDFKPPVTQPCVQAAGGAGPRETLSAFSLGLLSILAHPHPLCSYTFLVPNQAFSPISRPPSGNLASLCP